MPGDGRQRNVERLRQLTDCGFSLRKAREDGATGGIGQGSKGVIEAFHLTV